MTEPARRDHRFHSKFCPCFAKPLSDTVPCMCEMGLIKMMEAHDATRGDEEEFQRKAAQILREIPQ